jgi:hypothetical protein
MCRNIKTLPHRRQTLTRSISQGSWTASGAAPRRREAGNEGVTPRRRFSSRRSTLIMIRVDGNTRVGTCHVRAMPNLAVDRRGSERVRTGGAEFRRPTQAMVTPR